jgi:hypothetical protein
VWSGWTEVIDAHHAVEDRDESLRLLGSWVAENGGRWTDLDLRTDVRVNQCNQGAGRPHIYSFWIRDEALQRSVTGEGDDA